MRDELRVFYAADLHGADVCFKKWLKAGAFYGADVAIIGGDLTGKVLVPVLPLSRGGREVHAARWQGRDVELETRAELDEFVRTVRERGAYGFVTTPDELAEIRQTPERERATFTRLKLAALEEWIAWADARLADQRVTAVVMPGNDDPPEIDELLATSRQLVNSNGRTLELLPWLWMASRGESTPTPWHTPRELPDEELGRCVAELLDGLPAGAQTIWNLHMPPHRTGIDDAPKIDADLRVQYDGSGEPVMIPVGSSSIRQLILDRQPTLALHGHIHEGRGRYRLGQTTGFNPGSRYEDGVLLGVLVSLSARNGVRDYAFTAG